MNGTIALQTEKILLEARDGVAWIAINNPARRNAISLEMWRGLAEAAAIVSERAELRVAVIHGTGGQAFASGADISEFDKQRADAAQQAEYERISAQASQALGNLEKPLIAMIDGYCIGGGLATALLADLRFATPRSTFAIPAARLGLGYGYAGVANLARLVGPSNARDILFSARRLDAAEAHRIGLVNRVVAQEGLHAEVQTYAATVASNAPLTIRAAKAAIRAFERQGQGRETDAVTALVTACFESDDYREGRRAFAEKRPPVFKGA